MQGQGSDSNTTSPPQMEPNSSIQVYQKIAKQEAKFPAVSRFLDFFFLIVGFNSLAVFLL